MSSTKLGLLFCVLFVTLEAFQAVYLGSVFQAIDSFLVGAWVFGISVIGTVVVTLVFHAHQLATSCREWRLIVALNIYAAITWSTYFGAVQIIEPAVLFTIFSGMVPIGTAIAAFYGMKEALAPKRIATRIGNGLILLSIVWLCASTIAGMSGFVRGGTWTAFLGVALSVLSGGCTSLVILYSARLNARGVGPLAQFGLRFVLYTALAVVAVFVGVDEKREAPTWEALWPVVLVGLAVIALPLYLVQKAVPLIPASTIAAMTALGPVFVFAMQVFEGRVDYAPATLLGIIVFLLGALIAVWGATRTQTT
ncbi:MAG: DMT family transporter [Pseudomonadota bacterium]